MAGITGRAGAAKRGEKRKEPLGKPRALAASDYRRLAEFRHVLRHFLAFSENAAARTGLSGQQHQALLAVKGFGLDRALTIGALADRLGIRHHSAVGLIDRLVEKSLLKRLKDPADRRQVLLALTPKAERLLARLSRAHRDELERIAPLLEELLRPFKPGAKRQRPKP